MATSGSVNSSKARDSYFRVSWERTSYSIPNNTSTIKWTLYLVSGNYWYTNAVVVDSVTINGEEVVKNQKYSNKYDSTYTLASGTTTIGHNADGTKSFNISIRGSFYEEGSVSGSSNFEINSIPRYASVSQSNSSKTETSITMKWTSDSTVDYIWVSKNDGSTWEGIDVADGTSGTYSFTGLSANTKYNVKTRVRRKDSQLTTDSSALAVTTYAYPYCNSAPNFIIGEQLTLGIYNPLARSVTVNIIGDDDSQCSNDTRTGTSITGYNGDGVVSALYASIPNSASGAYKVKVTYGSHVSTVTGGAYAVNPSACSPSIGSVAYADSDASVVAITGNNQDIVRQHSTVQFMASGLAAQKGATVSACSVTVNGSTYALTLSGDSATGGNAKIDSGTNVEAMFTVTDSRGITASKTLTVNMLDWKVPSALITMRRQNNFYSETDITVDAEYSYINGGNQITITYKAKIEGTSEFTVSGSLSDNVKSTFVADNSAEWDVVVTLVDSFGGTATYTLHLSRGMPIIYFDRLKSSVGVNCFPQEEKSLELSGCLRVDGGIRNTMVSGDILTYAVSVGLGVHFITVDENTTNTPNTTTYKYSSGVIMRRAANQIVIVLFRYNLGEMAINATEDGGTSWTGWSILTEYADHVVEQGLSTVQGSQTCNWYYQKFASGQFVARMSGVLSSSTSNTSKSATFKLPFSLPNTIYGVQLTGTVNSNLLSNMGVRNSAGSGSGKTTEQFTVYAILSAATTASIGVDIEVRGYWM